MVHMQFGLRQTGDEGVQVAGAGGGGGAGDGGAQGHALRGAAVGQGFSPGTASAPDRGLLRGTRVIG
ncbi:hypothetical protein E4N62_34635 [Streptomyces sp. MNU76]|uniref:hypothetical protein n=1 Tax=Streptomyces sp. MNU76 TaxID=2560026 RepID=UPI001E4AC2D6|nr:hypothetical protein [Streptomyces sp. MNU76]